MAYATIAGVTTACGGPAAYVALTDLDGDQVADAAVVADAMVAADREIDSYAAKRFAVPMETVSEYVVKLACRLAAFSIRTDRQAATVGDVTQHTADLEWLKGLRDGVNSPGIEPTPAKSELQVDRAGTRDSTKNVSREKLKGYW